LELFFSVEAIGGTLKQGLDPELPSDGQLISEVSFKTLNELNKIPLSEKHAILHELVDFDDLFIPQHRFV
jgi:8-oxo-dGTP diphosphatase